ncbi:hypothetical protein GCM10008022_05750 [Paenibacillus hunanensis]|nr:hypothetical protein GCM10008022_05750 [Paenibacillus hunanensis]
MLEQYHSPFLFIVKKWVISTAKEYRRSFGDTLFYLILKVKRSSEGITSEYGYIGLYSDEATGMV